MGSQFSTRTVVGRCRMNLNLTFDYHTNFHQLIMIYIVHVSDYNLAILYTALISFALLRHGLRAIHPQYNICFFSTNPQLYLLTLIVLLFFVAFSATSYAPHAISRLVEAGFILHTLIITNSLSFNWACVNI